ncbi:MAG: crossover junction endodeoxyribonuclease RuvC [Bacteroidota bacterium]|jgi:Holliday junction resolvasome RuvABC endonuclease subunit
MKKKNSKRILGIDPGTKYIGFALMESEKLIYYGVKTIPRLKTSKATLEEGKRIVSRLMDDFRPNILVVEKTYFANNKNSILLNTFTAQIRRIGKGKGLEVLSIATNTVRKAVCGNGAASKDEVAKAIVARYPQLKPYLTSDKKWKEKYHRNMFDAVAIGLASLLSILHNS